MPTLQSMRLYLLRSAEATSGKKDARRKLTENGVASLAKLVDFLGKKKLADVAEIRHSPFVRAAQTAKHIKAAAFYFPVVTIIR